MGHFKSLIVSAASKTFGDVFAKDDFIIAYFKLGDFSYQCIFHEADHIFRARLFPLVGLEPIVVPPGRRDAVLQYFGAVNAVSHISDGWLKLHPEGEICCQAEIVIAIGVEDLDDLLPLMVRNARNTLFLWWPGLTAVTNDGTDPVVAFRACKDGLR
jgi:hypothetical protein